MRSRSMLVWVGTALLGLAMAGIAACGGSGGSGGGRRCISRGQEEGGWPRARQGGPVCAADGKSFEACQCGTGGGTGSSSSTGQMGSCGDGIIQPGECNPGEFFCKADCGSSSSSGAGGNACAGHVYYAASVTNVPSVW